MKTIKILGLVLLASVLSSCSYFKKDTMPVNTLSAQELYQQGEQALANGNYKHAAQQLATLEAEYPFGEYSQQGLIDLAYAYYKNHKYITSSATGDRYIRLYPRAKNIDYAYYLKGLANSQVDRGVLGNYFHVDASLRDPATIGQAYQNFKILVTRYPKSQYAADASQRMINIRNMLAQHELGISKFYFKRKEFVASLNRATYLIENYPQAPQAEGGLVMLVKANRALHLEQPANNALRVLEKNYPHSPELAKLKA